MLNSKALTLAVIIGVLSPVVPINVLSESDVLAQTQEERKAEADRLYQQGIQQYNKSQFREAFQSWQKALIIYREIGDRHGVASSLDNLGIAYRSLGQYQKAIEYHQQSLAIKQEIGDRQGVASSLGNLGSAYRSLGQYQQAIEYHQQSLAIKQEIGDRQGVASSLNNIGIALELQKQPELAITFLKKFVNVTESIRQDIQGLSAELQQSYAETVADNYRHLAELLLQQDRVLEAQEVIDLLKLQELEDYLRDVRGNEKTAQGLDFWPSEKRVLELFDQWLQQNPQGDFDNFIKSSEVTAEVTKLQRTARGQNLNPEQLVQLQDNLESVGNAALLYPLILEDRLELVLVTTAGLVRKTVPISRVELNRMIVDYRSDITDRSSNPIPNAQRLYKILIQPIIEELGETEVILYAADGQLRYIPLAALHDGEQWLTQQFVINHITAASLTDFTRSNPNPTKILAAAFSDASQSYDVPVGDEILSFQGLEFAGKEVALIADIPGTLALYNQDFSRAKVEPQMDQYSVVHLATHAEFVSGNPHQSFILFGDGDRVTLPDISNWKLPNTDLVVLSACRTAVSDELGNGEEILGFGYQIQRTGAEAAIASLWYVNDGGTQALMNGFYHGLQQKEPMSQALQKAQIALITNNFSAVGGERGGDGDFIQRDVQTGLPIDHISNNLSHPYYWAPFILIGNGL
jgi:CHAT domain-containing protein/Flp pilus assembly protein TadD